MEELRIGPVPPAEQISEKAGELWDIYDLDRKRTGRVHRRGDPWPDGAYRLCVHICIFNGEGKLLIQQRQPWKKGWSGMWDVSVGGSALAGDDSRTAAQREVQEELGLALDLSGMRPVFSVSFSQGFDDFWLIRQEVRLEDLTLSLRRCRQSAGPAGKRCWRWCRREHLFRTRSWSCCSGWRNARDVWTFGSGSRRLVRRSDTAETGLLYTLKRNNFWRMCRNPGVNCVYL